MFPSPFGVLSFFIGYINKKIQNYLQGFRLLSEFYPFLLSQLRNLKQQILETVSVSFRSSILFYPLTINLLFYDMLFGYFRENYLNFQFFLQKKKNYVLIPIFTVSWQFLYKIIIFVFNFC